MTRFGRSASAALAAAILVSDLTSPVLAQQDRDADLRCLAAFAARASAAADEKAKQQATIGLIYFFGRIDGEAPQTDLEAELEKLGQSMSEADLATALTPCAQRLGERGKVLMTIGDALQQKGR